MVRLAQLRRTDRSATGLGEKAALDVGACLCAPFAILSSAVPFKGPVLVAIYAFTAILLTAVIGGARVAFAGGIAGVARISRHLWRTCLGLSLAAGSAFTSGFARLLPGGYHVPAPFFVPQFLPLIPLACWIIRVRLTSGKGREWR